MAIFSISRREDIPAFGWHDFAEQAKTGSVSVSNRRYNFDTSTVDGLVFWTKNPSDEMFEDLKSKNIAAFDKPWYIQWTISPYGTDVEPHVPNKRLVIEKMNKWAAEFGKERIIWRYDPILISDRYTVDYHLKAFSKMTDMLDGSFRKCVISFLDMYGFVTPRCNALGIRPPMRNEEEQLCKAFSAIAAQKSFSIEACAERLDLKQYDIGHTHCIDYRILHELGMDPHELVKDSTQRKACGCMPSIDLGDYNRCKHGCVYCYATK